jgi:hypothetical protein
VLVVVIGHISGKHLHKKSYTPEAFGLVITGDFEARARMAGDGFEGLEGEGDFAGGAGVEEDGEGFAFKGEGFADFVAAG